MQNNSLVFTVDRGQPRGMPTRDRLLAIAVAVMWGANFIAIHVTLEHFPPLFAAALRFAVIAVPTLLLVPRPKVRARWLIGYGLGFGTGQFAFLFVAMHAGMPTGLASLVLQASAPMTVLLGAILLRERNSPRAVVGICLAVGGMSAIAWQRAEHAALLPVALTLLAALSWAFGNLSNRRGLNGGDVNPMHFMLWMCVIPPVPLYALSLAFEGPDAGWQALTTVATPSGWLALGGLAYVVLIATVTGSGVWSALMRRHAAATVAPFSLLVPVVGMTLAFALLGEQPTAVELAAGIVVILGVLLGSSTLTSSRLAGYRAVFNTHRYREGRDDAPPVQHSRSDGRERPGRRRRGSPARVRRTGRAGSAAAERPVLPAAEPAAEGAAGHRAALAPGGHLRRLRPHHAGQSLAGAVPVDVGPPQGERCLGHRPRAEDAVDR